MPAESLRPLRCSQKINLSLALIFSVGLLFTQPVHASAHTSKGGWDIPATSERRPQPAATNILSSYTNIIDIDQNGWDGDTQTSDPIYGTGDDAWRLTTTVPAKVTVTVLDCCLIGDSYSIFISGHRIGTTPWEDINSTTLSQGTFSKLVGPGVHMITITDPGGVYWYSQGNTAYANPAGYHVTITVTPLSINRPILFVHGINQNASEMGSKAFAPLYQQLISSFGKSNLETYMYLDDIALQDQKGTCPANIYPPCMSQGSVTENAPSLASQIRKMYTAAHHKVTLIGYSMGASIIRTALAGCPVLLTNPLVPVAAKVVYSCQDVPGMVDNVFFINGVQEGSWLMNAFVGMQQSSDLSLQLLAAALTPAASTFLKLRTDSPAAIDLSPHSNNVWMHNRIDPPNGIQYFNVFGDIQVQMKNLVAGIYQIPSGEPVSLGDLVIAPGFDDPHSSPALGGSRFCEGCGDTSNATEYHKVNDSTSFTQWKVATSFSWSVDPNLAEILLFGQNAGGAVATDLLLKLQAQPQWHLGIITTESLNSIMIPDTTGTGNDVTIPTEFAWQLDNEEGILP